MLRLRLKRPHPRSATGGTSDTQSAAESKDRVVQIRRQSMTNLATELGVTIFVAYLVITLNGIDQICEEDVHRECLDFYLLNNGSGSTEFVQKSCPELRKSCRHSGLFNNHNSNLEQAIKEDPTNATLAGIDPELYKFYYHEIIFCFCLLNDITFNDTTGALLTVEESSHGQEDCDFTLTRGIFFIVGVIIVALMEGSTLTQEKSIHRWENWLEVFGRIVALLGSIGYFFAIIIYFEHSTNPHLKCKASHFYEIADVCIVMGIISLVAVLILAFFFESKALYHSLVSTYNDGKSGRGSSNSIAPAKGDNDFEHKSANGDIALEDFHTHAGTK